MKIDETEFRTFLITIYNFVNQVKLQAKDKSDKGERDLTLSHNKLLNQHLDYVKQLEGAKPSKWKQLKINL